MKIYSSIFYFIGIALLLSKTDANAMDDSDKKSLKLRTGLHYPIKSTSNDFIIVPPLENPHLDKYGKIYYTASKKRKNKLPPPKSKSSRLKDANIIATCTTGNK